MTPGHQRSVTRARGHGGGGPGSPRGFAMRIDVRRGMVSALLLSAAVGLGGGCATGRPMAFAPGAPPLALGATEGLALGTVKLANLYKPGCQPHAQSLVVRSSAGSARFKTVPFRQSAAEGNQFEEILVTLPLAP